MPPRTAAPSAVAAHLPVRVTLGTLAGALLMACTAGGSADAEPPKQRASYTEKIRGTDVEFEMVWLQHAGFWMGKTEVTWDEYLKYCDFGERQRIPPGVDAVTRPSKPLDDVTPFDRDWGLGKRPAVGISWNAAKKYCQWLSLNTGNPYRLPTETEWLAACGARAAAMDEHAWHAGNSDQETHEVGSKAPNEYGLHDMFGNLWEYCANPFSAEDPARAVFRGGSWCDAAGELGPDGRLGFDSDWVLDDPNVPPGVWWVPSGDHIGFRLLRPVTEAGQ